MGVADSVSGVADSVTRFRFFQTEATPRQFRPRAKPPKSGPPEGPPGKLPTVDPPKFDPDPSDFDFPHRKYKKTKVFSMADTETNTGL